MFARHNLGAEVHYQNVFGTRAASENTVRDYDLTIITYEVLAHREWIFWPELASRLKRLTSHSTNTVLLAQDDYTYSSRLDELAVSLGAAVYSPIGSDLQDIYPGALSKELRIRHCLTGYLEPASLALYEKYRLPMAERTRSLGQRVSKLPLSFGELGRRKAVFAEDVAEFFRKAGHSVDVSTRQQDSIIGLEWLRFLGNCKLTVSRKGGASLVDPENKAKSRLRLLDLLLPFISEEKRFALAGAGTVIQGNYSAESPRLFEAAALGVVQILEEDRYLDGALVPGEHYISLKSDYRNIDEVLTIANNDTLLEDMSEAAYSRLIYSESFTYEFFVRNLLREELGWCYQTSKDALFQIVDLDEGWSSHQTLVVDRIKRVLASVGNSKTNVSGDFKRDFRLAYEAVCRFEKLPETLFLKWRTIKGVL